MQSHLLAISGFYPYSRSHITLWQEPLAVFYVPLLPEGLFHIAVLWKQHKTKKVICKFSGNRRVSRCFQAVLFPDDDCSVFIPLETLINRGFYKRARTLSMLLEELGIITNLGKCSVHACEPRTDVVYIKKLLGHSLLLLSLPWNHQPWKFCLKNVRFWNARWPLVARMLGLPRFWWRLFLSGASKKQQPTLPKTSQISRVSLDSQVWTTPCRSSFKSLSKSFPLKKRAPSCPIGEGLQECLLAPTSLLLGSNITTSWLQHHYFLAPTSLLH